MPRTAALSPRVLAVLFVGALLVPLLPGEFWTHVGNEILILGLFAMSFNLIYGYMGQISFGHAAFFGLGAYATAIVFRELSAGTGEIGTLGFLLSLLAGPPVAALGAVIVGFFCVRLTGIYFAILTLAFGELLFYTVFSWYGFTGGDDGIQRLLPPPFFRDATTYYYFTLVIVALAVALMWRITESPFGYTLRAMRDNQQRSRFLGIDVRLQMLSTSRSPARWPALPGLCGGRSRAASGRCCWAGRNRESPCSWPYSAAPGSSPGRWWARSSTPSCRPS